MGNAAAEGTIGLTDEHLALHAAARRWVAQHVDAKATKAALDEDDEQLPPFWDALVAQGWLGLHLAEEDGGEGYGLAELAVVLEELGRACAPGPFLPTALAAAVLSRHGTADQRARWLPDLAAGRRTGAVALGGAAAGGAADGPTGDAGGAPGGVLVLGGGSADVLVVPGPDGRLVVVERSRCTVRTRRSLDGTRRLADVVVDSPVPEADVLAVDPADVRRLGALLLAAEAVGGAAWCVDTAATYAAERRQFGRPIGQFQAVKHRCADMLLALELARATVWDAVRGTGDAAEQRLAEEVAAAVVPELAATIAKDCIQVLGGIGYTWEHDAHLHLKRAAAVPLLLGRADERLGAVATTACAGVRRTMRVELPPEAEPVREEVRAFVAELQARPKGEWTGALAAAGYLQPAWPVPWGRDAGPLEQLVIDEVFDEARLRRPHLQVGAWVLPTLIVHGTADQQERWIRPTLDGRILWCQLFSEPEAGSDLASLTTRAVRDDEHGGWRVTGQKVWTTMAHLASWGILLARTDPAAPRHEGITCFLLDMASPGVDVRPLRELTGAELFNEVFLDDVLIPDDCVVGPVNGGWEAARTTLGNERVSMGSGSSFGPGVESVVALVPEDVGSAVLAEVGSLVATATGLAALGLRTTLRALAGAHPGPEASVRKLIATEHEQRVQEVALALLGPAGAVDEGEGARWIAGFLGNRALSIAGGTSDIQRNVVAERLLGLPKDPLPGE